MENSNKKICGQVSTPSVDNESSCTSFMPVECVILNNNKRIVRTYPGENLDSYLLKLENKFRTYEAKIKLLEKKVAVLLNNPPII